MQRNLQDQSLTTPDIISIASMATAICALLATIWQATLTREHNRKSTMPILTFHFVTTAGCKIIIRNDGVGPAIIDEVRYFYDKKKCATSALFEQRVIEQSPVEYVLTSITSPASIGVGQSVEIFTITDKTADDQIIRETTRLVGFQVVYKSVYGDARETDVFPN